MTDDQEKCAAYSDGRHQIERFECEGALMGSYEFFGHTGGNFAVESMATFAWNMQQ
ncbi:hypothetical protein [Candidatus Entotheonella palauensis]|uniref:Uncharacterized protein n=1 Tax=Entotheonella factor TaxID=1429438 RepID=W4M023_ENTF1|nr:hypothetical protein [Candidatus Entotheonella palauensis]ETX03694.1 MAG: hypothetical protein ETSY1_46440 [Candidatus Entotheonella factor]